MRRVGGGGREGQWRERTWRIVGKEKMMRWHETDEVAIHVGWKGKIDPFCKLQGQT